MKKVFQILLFFFSILSYSQEIFYHTSYASAYSYLDEMANQGIITLYSAVKPHSRKFIADKLTEAKKADSLLDIRQKKDLEFLLKDFNKEIYPDKSFNKRPDLFYYRDSLFSFSINPIVGIQYWANDSGSWYHRWNGAEAFATIGKHWAFYASLRDNHESTKLSNPDYLVNRIGGNYKNTDDGGGDYSEMRGGVTYSWNWGSIGLLKDHFQWGSNYNGANIFSGNTPSFPFIKLYLNPVDWFEFNYIHAWLVSSVVDSARSYYVNNTLRREVFHNKYMAANFFTFQPFKRLFVSFGNSIIYSDIGVHPAYLIPILFYKSVDHTLNNTDKIGKNVGQNSQMFFDISSRQIKHLHLYTSLFVDEVEIGTMWDPDKHSNYFSYKAGFCLDGYPLRNIALHYEYTRTNPLVYKHDITTTTFASNLYNLGHYLGDNTQEHYIGVRARIIRGLRLNLSYLHAEKGEDMIYERKNTKGLTFMEYRIWTHDRFSAKLSYEAIHDGYIFCEYSYSNITGEVDTYTPLYWQGKNNTVSIGLNFGF